MQRRNGITLGIVAACAAVAMTSAACAPSNGGGGGGSDSSSDPINIGLLASKTGAVGTQGTLFGDGVQLAVDQINADGGVKGVGGRKLKVTAVDDQSDPATARSGAIQLIKTDKVAAILGPYGTSACLSASAVTQQYKTPAVCSAASDAVTAQKFSYIFNMATIGTTYATSVFDFLNAVKPAAAKKIAVLYEDSAYGTGLNTAMEAAANKNDGDIAVSLSFKAGTSDLSPLVTRAKGSGALVIVVAAFTPDVINTLRAVKTTGTEALVVSFSGGVINPAVTKLGSAAEGVVGIGAWNSAMANRPELQPFLDKFKARYNTEASADAASGWTAAYELLAALNEAKSVDPTAIRDGLRKITVSIGINPPYTADFDDTGLMINQRQSMLGAQLINGKFETVWPQKVATASIKG